MPRKLLLPAIVALAITAAAVIVAHPAPTTADTALDSEEQAFVNLINQYRAQNGRGPLSIDPSLAAAADWMSFDMGVNNYFSHTDSLGRDPFQRMNAFGYNYNTWRGENIAAGTSSAQTVFDLWRNSPGHNANMLNANYKVMGIARAYTSGSGYGWYWTNDFGGYIVPATPTPSPSPAPTPSPTPAPNADADGDGFSNAVEAHLGTSPNDSCGNPDTTKTGSPSLSWPADLNMGASANKIDIMDIVSFIAPVRRLGASPGDAAFDLRWDIVPGKGAFAADINITDLNTLSTLAPPMFGNQRAFNGPACLNP